MAVLLRPRYSFKVPLNAKCISPDVFASKTVEEIKALKVWEGNRQRALGELFEVDGESAPTPKEVSIRITGDLREAKRISEGMSEGEITIEGDVGLHLGEKMTAGRIIVSGNAGSWLGAMMKGGSITVNGNAGDYVGAAYRGSNKGMQGGTIEIHGNVGNEAGCFMREGLIKIGGKAGQFLGMHMRNGTIVVNGDSDGRAGAGMVGGRIVLLGSTASVLPNFSIDSIRKRVEVDGEEIAGPFYLFIGDVAEKGNGKLYISQANNQHLSFREKYL
jgi:formylmethanofuran dehydrogenase subunit C